MSEQQTTAPATTTSQKAPKSSLLSKVKSALTFSSVKQPEEFFARSIGEQEFITDENEPTCAVLREALNLEFNFKEENQICWEKFYNAKKRKLRVLCLDGGGIKGIVLCHILMELEYKTKKPIHELFDVICGTSTGGIVAMCCGLGKYSATETYLLYKQLKSDVFGKKNKTPIPAYFNNGPLETLLQNLPFGKNWMSDYAPCSADDQGQEQIMKHPLVFCCALSMAKNAAVEPFIFRNYTYKQSCMKDEDNGLPKYKGSIDYRIWEALRSTSAAPGYFTPFVDKETKKSFIDGGLGNNNPTALALTEIKQIFCNEQGKKLEDVLELVVSIGTGSALNSKSSYWGHYFGGLIREKQNEPNSGLQNLVYNGVSGILDIKRMFETASILVENATNVDLIDSMCSTMFDNTSVNYCRLNPSFIHFLEMDEVDETKIQKMEHETRQFIIQNEQKINKIIELVTS